MLKFNRQHCRIVSAVVLHDEKHAYGNVYAGDVHVYRTVCAGQSFDGYTRAAHGGGACGQAVQPAAHCGIRGDRLRVCDSCAEPAGAVELRCKGDSWACACAVYKAAKHSPICGKRRGGADKRVACGRGSIRAGRR